MASPPPSPPRFPSPRRGEGRGEGVPGAGPSSARFVVVALLTLSTPAIAQTDPHPDAAGQALKRVEQELQNDRNRQRQLDRQSQTLDKELNELRGQVIGLADQARVQERGLDELEGTLAALEAEEQRRTAALDSERAQIAGLLAALQRLARVPPEAALIRPEGPVDTLRSALLLRDTVPALRARADALLAALTGLAETRESLVAQRAKALAARKALAEKQADISRLVSRREELSRQTDAERQQLAQHMGQLSGQASDLRQLMDRIESERRAAAETAAKREAERRDSERKEAEKRQAEQREAERRLAAQKEAERKEAERKLAELRAAEQKAAAQKAAEEQRAKDEAARAAAELALAKKAPSGPPSVAGMPTPVGGKLTTRFGETDRFGATSRGVTIQTRAAATVVAPQGGSVVYAGPFKGYGLILIVEHSGGYHSLIAGLGRIDTAVGKTVAAGEPIAVMPGDGAPDLYFELRRNGQPINPQRGFGTPEGKGRG
ncbi:metallopeptidase [Azospirillum griseum]|uniref:Metallopeptidase n=1 Tax=Azospirillum griseum TaxID=2496639 RepID=A0A3S0HYK7_9PROT|nr:metallopeptidase [Azospirillum griseum]